MFTALGGSFLPQSGRKHPNSVEETSLLCLMPSPCPLPGYHVPEMLESLSASLVPSPPSFSILAKDPLGSSLTGDKETD